MYLFILLTILYWFCHTLTWILTGRTCAPHPESPSHLLPHPIPLGHPSAPALSTLSHASNLDWRFITHMIIYIFQCHFLIPLDFKSVIIQMNWTIINTLMRAGGFPGGSYGKEYAFNAGNPGLIPGSGISPWKGHGNPLQYSCLENSIDRGAWWAT